MNREIIVIQLYTKPSFKFTVEISDLWSKESRRKKYCLYFVEDVVEWLQS